MKKFTSPGLHSLIGKTGFLTLGLMVLLVLTGHSARAQDSFSTPQVLSGDWGTISNLNTGVTPDTGAPSNAGFPPNAPLWYAWTASHDGEVDLDTVGGVELITNLTFTGSFNTNTLQPNFTTNILTVNLDTVLGVYTGSAVADLTQVAANDDLFPISAGDPQENDIASADYIQLFGTTVLGMDLPYNGPSHLRFNATGGTTYYFAVDTKAPITGNVVLSWAYESSGVFRFATEDFDPTTELPLYQTAQTESQLPEGTDDDENSPILTYYTYNAQGVLVTVTRSAGSTGRVMLNYTTEDGTNLVVPANDVAGVAGVDYQPVSGTLVFDDYEMSKTILIPIVYRGATPSDQTNRVFGITLVNDGGVTSPILDPLESSEVSPPRVDPVFNTAMIRILNANADPYGPDYLPVTVTNNIPPGSTNFIVSTNMVLAQFPTNNIFNFEKAHYRVPADVNGPNSPWTYVALYVERFGTNRSAETINYRVNNLLGSDSAPSEELNIYFPLQAASDYAVPTPATWSPVRGTNSDFSVAAGTISFPSSGAGFAFQKITFTVPTSSLTKFNKDFKVELYREVTISGQTVPEVCGMADEATVTILTDDQTPPAGSVDELYNADFNRNLALPPTLVPVTTPQNDANPGPSGQVNGMVVLTNNETVIVGDFPSYNGFGENCVALVNTNGLLDTSFNPGSGPNSFINAVGLTANNELLIGGAFTSFNGVQENDVALLHPNGSLDQNFSPGAADGIVRAVAVESNGKILIGGDFTHYNGVPRNYIARLNADGSLDTSFDPSNTFSGSVYALAVPPSFNTSVSNQGTNNEVDQAIGLGQQVGSGTLTVNYNVANDPSDLRVFYGDTNVAGGTGVLIFDTGSVALPGNFVLPFGPTNGLDTNLITIVVNQGNSGTVGTVWSYTASVSKAASSSGIMVGGSFAVSGQIYNNVARLNDANGTLDTTFNPGTGPDGNVLSLGWQYNGQVVAGGLFAHVNGTSLNNLARFNADGSLDTTNFFPGSGPDDVVYNIAFQQYDGAIYIGGAFASYNGTHRLGFARLNYNGTLDTTFLDTAHNQFAGLKRIYSYDSPAVYASGIDGNGNVLIGGSFNQVGGGQADTNVCNVLDDELGYGESFGDTNLWVEPKTRDGVRNRSNFARLIGGATPGPGNIGFLQSTYPANKTQSALSVSLVRTNGNLGPVAANFSVQPGLAQSGVDYVYNSAPPLYWIGWEYLVHPTRDHSDGLDGQNLALVDPYGLDLSASDAKINNLSGVNVSIRNDKNTSGNLNAEFQLANPSGADTFYLGGEEIPLGGALGASSAAFSLIDDNEQAGTFGFSSATYVATNASALISLVRSNGDYGTVTLRYNTTNGTALAGTDYVGLTNKLASFAEGVFSNNFNVTIDQNGFIYTNIIEKSLSLKISSLSAQAGANVAYGISNAVLRLINPNYQGYLSLSTTNFTGLESSGFINFVVNRVSGSLGTISVQYATTNGTALSGQDYIGATNQLLWNSGDASSRIVSIPLINVGAVTANKQFGVVLFNPTNGAAGATSLMGLITNATLTIDNDNSYGSLQFSEPSYTVNENGGSATITVVRGNGAAGAVSVGYTTSNSNAVSGVNYTTTSGVLNFTTNQLSASFTVPILNDGVVDPPPANFSFTVSLSNPVNASLGAITNAAVHIVDAQSYNFPPGSIDEGFDPATGFNGNVFALALQSTGEILVGGNFSKVGGDLVSDLARLQTNGSVDTSFMSGSSGMNGAVQAIADQTDDRIIVGGTFTSVNGVNQNRLTRLMTDGTIDSTFDVGSGADSPVDAVAEAFIGGTRYIYAGGAFGNFNGVSSPGIVRLQGGEVANGNGGTVDSSFATGLGADAAVLSIAVYSTNSPYAGKVLVGGGFTHFNGNSQNYLIRLNQDGSQDTNYNANLGFGPDGPVHAIVVQLDGRVIVGGSFTNFNGVALNGIARLNVDGTLDTNFTANVGTGANGAVEALALQPDNRIVVVGQFTEANGVTRNSITRLLPTGATDPTINFGDGANGDVDAVLVQPADGMLVIGGDFSEFDDQPVENITRIYGGSVTGSGQLEFTSSNYQVNENGFTAVITVRRTGGTSGPNPDGSGVVSVNFNTSDGTAVAETNYVAVSTTVNFPPGEVLESVPVTILDNGAITPNLTVNLALSEPTPPATLGNQPTATLTILTTGSAVSFSSAFYSQVKNVASGMATIDVIRLGGTNTTSMVDFYTTTNGTATPFVDYIPTNLTLTFNPGQTVLPVQIPIINNNLVEGNTTVGMLLTNPVNTVIYTPSNAVLTIVNTTPAPGQLSFSATNFVASQSAPDGFLTVVRNNGSSGSVSVSYVSVPGTAQPGVNYTTVNGTLTFDDGETNKTISVPLAQGSQAVGTVSLSVVLSNPTGGASLVAPTNASLTIVETNSAVAFASATNNVSGTAGTVELYVALFGATNGITSVNYYTTNGTAVAGSNYVAAAGTLTFFPGENLKPISVTLLNDPLVTSALTFGVNLTNASSGTQIIKPSGTVVVEQSANVGLSFTTNSTSVFKNAGFVTIAVVCSNPGVEPVITSTNQVPLEVSYASVNGTALAGQDYGAVSGTLVFTNGIGTNTFNVPIYNNGLVTGNKTFSLVLANPTAPGQLTAPSTESVVIAESNAGMQFSQGQYSVYKNAGSVTIDVIRTGYTNNTVSVNFSATNGTAVNGQNYDSTSGTLVFTNGVTEQSFNIPILAYNVVQPNLTVLLQLTDATNGYIIPPGAATLNILENGGSVVIPAGAQMITNYTSAANGANDIIGSNDTVQVLFAFRDSAGLNVTNLVANLLTTNGVLSPVPASQTYGPLTVYGHSVSQPFTFTAHGTNTFSIAPTFNLYDNSKFIGTASFGFTIGTWTTTFSNSSAINITANAAASPYPAVINVSGVGGTLLHSTVTLTNLFANSPASIDALVVAPSGGNTLIMAHAGGQNTVAGIVLTFDDGATNFLSQTARLTTSTNKPTQYYPVGFFP